MASQGSSSRALRRLSRSLGRALEDEVLGLAPVRVRGGRGEGSCTVTVGVLEGHLGFVEVTLEVAAHGVPGRHPRSPAGAFVRCAVATHGARGVHGQLDT